MSSRRGVSLVELLIAMVILALGLLPVGLLFSTTGKETEHDRMELEAASLASEVLEQVRAIAEGRLGVPSMAKLPPENSLPELAKWFDVEAELQEKGPGFPLYDVPIKPEESSRMYIEPTRPGFRRWLQVHRAQLLKGASIAQSPNLIEIRVRVDYGIEKKPRTLTLTTLVSNEDVTAR